MLMQLRNTLEENCIEVAKMKMAEEIKQRLKNVSELEPNKKTEDIVKVHRLL